MNRKEISVREVATEKGAVQIRRSKKGEINLLTLLPAPQKDPAPGRENPPMKCRFDERGIFFINDKAYYLMARGGLEINFQLFNSGDLPLDILSVYVDDSLESNHLRVYLDGVYQQGAKVRFPLHLEKGEFLTLQSRHKISLGMGSTDALFAADMRSLPKSILYDVIVNTSNEYGKKQSYVAELTTSSKFLVDLYVNQWREYGQQEYLVLAGHGQTGENV